MHGTQHIVQFYIIRTNNLPNSYMYLYAVNISENVSCMNVIYTYILIVVKYLLKCN